MDSFQAFFLGLLQGLTEFLPISSTGHLILFSKFFDIPSNLSFDAFLHLGSFLAIFIYFRKELKEIWKIKNYILISIIPGGIAGLSLEHFIEEHFRTPFGVAFFLLFMTIPMFLGEKFGKKRETLKDLTYLKALFIGIFQALALLPGTSRSGITISAGLLFGLKREEAARYSFLAGAPLILGAGLYEGLKLLKNSSIDWYIASSGFIASFISSFIAIAFLIPFLKRHSLNIFIFYRIALALAIFLTILLF
ncbi:MAG: undecaprenyl-diphosphate phosphatase [Caldimicrobium sp.]